MSKARGPAVAGSFYPADPAELEAAVAGYLDEARRGLPASERGDAPKAVIAPHAGYVYSGPIAASVYARVEALRAQVRRVVLLGPCHREPIQGLALPDADAFATPLGEVPVDREAVEALLRLPQVALADRAHEGEHSLEVQLPFLQRVLERFSLVPLAVGAATPEETCEVLESVWGGAETLIVISSDLSHYHDYATARELDAATSRAIEALDPAGLGPESACGRVPARGLLLAARRHGLSGRTVDLRNSGDTAGPRGEVVGYGAYVFA